MSTLSYFLHSGIGLTLAERLLTTNQNLQLCLACRNKDRAEAAKRSLELSHPGAKISVVMLDTSNVASVFEAAAQIKEKYNKIDYLFMNAGIMSVSRVHWKKVFTSILSRDCVHALSTGEGLLQHVDDTTSDGLKKVFATNLFGHYILFRELEDCLGGTTTTQIIWTSSKSASNKYFHIEDMQHMIGIEPYSSSKYGTDVLSVAINERLNKKGVYSHTVSPGLVMSGMTYGILPDWLWTLIIPFLLLMRLIVSTLSINTYNGSEPLVWLSKQKAESLDPRSKYCSHVTFWGVPYVQPAKQYTFCTDKKSFGLEISCFKYCK
ncbi:hypothetical protein ACJMK2_023947 [Sinanodonta woodiana]|uniref:3-keto-steroid reductase n=1 Tax=Sinanodonta woodiana TaxID=1069815 RepID=A0ABD3T5V4_SINWO